MKRLTDKELPISLAWLEYRNAPKQLTELVESMVSGSVKPFDFSDSSGLIDSISLAKDLRLNARMGNENISLIGWLINGLLSYKEKSDLMDYGISLLEKQTNDKIAWVQHWQFISHLELEKLIKGKKMTDEEKWMADQESKWLDEPCDSCEEEQEEEQEDD